MLPHQRRRVTSFRGIVRVLVEARHRPSLWAAIDACAIRRPLEALSAALRGGRRGLRREGFAGAGTITFDAGAFGEHRAWPFGAHGHGALRARARRALGGDDVLRRAGRDLVPTGRMRRGADLSA